MWAGPHNLSRPAEVADLLFFGLLLAAIPFILPIASWVAARRTRARVEELSRTIRDQQSAIDTLSAPAPSASPSAPRENPWPELAHSRPSPRSPAPPPSAPTSASPPTPTKH